MKPFVLQLLDTDPLNAFAALQHLPYSVFFDSADRGHAQARYSFIGAFPVETVEAKDGRVTVTNARGQNTYEGDAFAVLKDRLTAWTITREECYGLPPFQGGAAGFFGYDLGRTIEEIPDAARGNPDMIDMGVGIYDQVLAYDHEKGKAWLITHAADEEEAATKQRFILKALAEKPQPGETGSADLDWLANFTRKAYEENVARVVEYIKAGDVFQVNLSQRFDAQLPQHFCAFSHYLNLRRVNAAPFSSFMNLGDIKISSASPERFVRACHDCVETRPIKGTMPRHEDPAIDQLNRNTLENSAKDRAENTMIVDLLRNDLSKVCDMDSVEVSDLCRLESFARVHHLVSTVKGFLHEEAAPLDVLRACFPGGSISGAPKIRAMEIIEELEPTRRGPYCGSMGYVGFSGTMDSNILIRTLVYQASSVSFQAGGGIVVDSDPAKEYQETLYKAAAMFESFEDEAPLKEAV